MRGRDGDSDDSEGIMKKTAIDDDDMKNYNYFMICLRRW